MLDLIFSPTNEARSKKCLLIIFIFHVRNKIVEIQIFSISYFIMFVESWTHQILLPIGPFDSETHVLVDSECN